MASREQGSGMRVSACRSNEMMRKVRERTELELAKRSVDLTTGGSRGTIVAAFAVAAALPLADSAHLLDHLADGVNLPLLEADDDRAQLAPCKRCTG